MGTLIIVLDILALIFIIPATLFILTHVRELAEKEIGELVRKRREKDIRRYFYYDFRQYRVSRELKKRMDPDGEFCPVESGSYEFPSFVGGLLKYKKHEWIIIGFEKNKEVDLMWMNKGVSRSRVSLKLPLEILTELAQQHNYDSVLFFHNHPNPDPGRYFCGGASEVDYKTASEFASTLNNAGINLVEYVCARGRHYEYYLSPSRNLLPEENYAKNIKTLNGASRYKNFSLHIERVYKNCFQTKKYYP